MTLRVLFLANDLSGNALGRSYSLALLAAELGHEAIVAGPASTGKVWSVLKDEAFAARCLVMEPGDSRLSSAAEDADVLVAVKVMPTSLGTGLELAASRKRPLILDVDDADADVLGRAARGALLHARSPGIAARAFRELLMFRRLQREAKSLTITVSNPVLQQMYGGTVIPHVREPRQPAPGPATNGVVVAFVGTPLWHKGIHVLRQAVAELAPDGFRLVATAAPPDDAEPWEDWRGQVSLEEGLATIDTADVVAVPSLNHNYGPTQLPVKVIDAMMAAKPIVASDLEPLAWALGNTGTLVEPGSMSALRDGLRTLRDPGTRARHGAAARERALSEFTPAAVGPRFGEVLDRSLSDGVGAS